MECFVLSACRFTSGLVSFEVLVPLLVPGFLVAFVSVTLCLKL